MAAHLLARALRLGFRKVKTDRVEEWSDLREVGFLRTWIRSTRLYPVLFALVSVIAAAFKRMAIPEALIGGLGVGLAMMVLIGVADGLYWMSREREWKGAKRNKQPNTGVNTTQNTKAEQGEAPNP